MKLVVRSGFEIWEMCGCSLDRLLATCPFSEAQKNPAKISVDQVHVLSPKNIVEHLSDDSLLPLVFLPQVEG